MAEINVPIVTIPQLHDSLQTISATDFIPIVQGSEYDRDAAATLSEILASNPFQDQKEWKTFLLSAAALDTGTWTHNALVLLDAWESSISYSGTSLKNGIMILIPKWSAAPEGTTSCTFAETEGTTCPILRGNFLLIRFGLDGKISSYFSIPASSVDAIAQLKSLSVTNVVTAGLVNADNVNVTNAVNATDVTATGNVIAANVIADIIHSNNNITADNNITAANAVNAANVTATGNVNANAVNATNVTATNAVNANAVNATNVTATNVTATNAVNAENVTATSGVSAAVVDAGTANVTNANATNVTITSNFTTTSIMSYTADVDLTTYVVDHNMVVGQHLFIINTGTADITVTGKVTSGSSEITKTWTLAIGTMCDFVAVPTASGSNAIAKLG